MTSDSSRGHILYRPESILPAAFSYVRSGLFICETAAHSRAQSELSPVSDKLAVVLQIY
jgi:hypothetical protein